MPEISIGTAISRAWERMMLVCFRPFDIGKWFTLGFCAWLAGLGEGGGSYNSRGFGNNNGRGAFDDVADTALDWLGEHLVLVVVLALAVILLFAGLSLLVTWLKSRGDFMFVDGIVRNRGAVREPWAAWADQANSLTWLRYALSMGMMVLALLILGAGGAGAYVAHEGGADTFVLVAIAGGAVLVLAPFAIGVGIVGWLLTHLVMPTMYARQVGVGEGFRAVRQELLPGNYGAVALYWLARIGVGIAIALVAIVVVLLTCCLAALPYIGSVILLPVSVFMRAMDLYFVEQFGDGFALFTHDDDDPWAEPAPAPAPAGAADPRPVDPDDPWAP